MKTICVNAILSGIFLTIGFYTAPVAFFVPVLLSLNLMQSAFTGVDPISRMVGEGKLAAQAAKKPARGKKAAKKK